MRLVGGPWAGEGLLEVYWYGAWMTLQVPAASLPVSSSVAAVVCRSLGMSSAGESPPLAKGTTCAEHHAPAALLHSLFYQWDIPSTIR